MGPSIFGSLEVKATIEYRGFSHELIHTPPLAESQARRPLAHGKR